jgi:zinc transport system substrate-binding protein
MIKFLFSLLIVSVTAVLFTACEQTHSTREKQRQVLVSIEPQQYFVERIAGNRVDVAVLVPPGGNPHAFEPTPKQMLRAGQSDVWFRLGETFETRALEVLHSHNPAMAVIDTRQGLQLLSLNGHSCHHCHCCGSDDKDTHIWLSPRLAKTQATTIANALTKQYPEFQQEFETGLSQFLVELDELDAELTTLFSSRAPRAILVSHPAFGYLCQDYGITQLSVEFEGKDPSPQQLTELLNKVKSLNITRVFTQEQYQNKGALLLAKELHAEVFSVDPYSRDYINNLRTMANLFAN